MTKQRAKEIFAERYLEYFNDIKNRYHYFSVFNNDFDPEDLAQQTMYQVFNKIEKSKNEESVVDFDNPKVEWYIRVIAANLLKSYFKRKKLYLNKREEIINFCYPDKIIPDVSEICLKKIELENIKKSVNLLNNQQKEILIKYFFEEKSQKEIAKELNLPKGTVKSRVHYGLKVLRAIMEN